VNRRTFVVAALFALAGTAVPGGMSPVPATEACPVLGEESLPVGVEVTEGVGYGARACVGDDAVFVWATSPPRDARVAKQKCTGSSCTTEEEVTVAPRAEVQKVAYDEEHAGTSTAEGTTAFAVIELRTGRAANQIATCTLTLWANSHYEKPSFSVINREYGEATGSVNCNPNPIYHPQLLVEATVTHHCVGNTHTDSDQQTTSGNSPLTLSTGVFQEVSIYGFGEWCAYGTLMTWRYKALARAYEGSGAQVCIYETAQYGTDPSGGPVQC
jgi:hypothetical protein